MINPHLNFPPMDNLRLLEEAALIRNRRGSTRQCGACGRNTTGGKPYCFDHLFKNDYARHLVDLEEASLSEVARAREAGWQVIDPEGPVCQEVVRRVNSSGQRTLARLAQEVAQLDTGVVGVYAEALVQAGRLVFATTRRGDKTLRVASFSVYSRQIGCLGHARTAL